MLLINSINWLRSLKLVASISFWFSMSITLAASPGRSSVR